MVHEPASAEIGSLADNLQLNDDGVWVSRSESPISYPADGNSECFAVEDSSFWFRHRNACLVAVVKRFPPQGPIFDIGGGNGVVAKALMKSGFDVVLVEPGREGVCSAKLRGITQLVCATLQDARFHAGVIPAIGIFDVLEHIEDDHQFLRELHTLLAPGGRVYITVPAYRFLWSIEDDLAGHFRRYTLSSLKKRFREAGFALEFASYFFGFLPLPIFAFRTIPTLLKRHHPSQERMESEHSGGGGATSGLLERILGAELKRFQNGGTLPFGGSCLAVARKLP